MISYKFIIVFLSILCSCSSDSLDELKRFKIKEVRLSSNLFEMMVESYKDLPMHIPRILQQKHPNN